MKRLITLLLAMSMVAALCAYGGTCEATYGTQTSEPASSVENENSTLSDSLNQVWTVQQTLDDFGDVTPDSERVIMAEIKGEFSNTATASSELTVNAFFRKNPAAPQHYIFEIALFEYATTPAAYLNRSSIQLKTKIGDEVSESSLVGNAPNGNVFAGLMEGDYYGDVYFNALYDGKDVRCIVNIDSSKYQFTLESSNFKTVCDSEDFPYAPGEMTIEESLVMFLEYQGKGYEVPHDCLLRHCSDFTRMDEYEISAVFMDGIFGCIEFIGYTPINDLKFPNAEVWQFVAGEGGVAIDCSVDYKLTQAALDRRSHTVIRDYDVKKNASLLQLRTEDGQLVMHNTYNEKDYPYLCYRITEGIYLLCSPEGRPIYLFYSCEGLEESDYYAATELAIKTIKG